ncbi:methyltransferase domain-containing protein [Salinisphaera sp. P385]|uniref:Arsenite methyltransferase n=1 Tax=Spectribacter acetivorans TaxID=3075603 RepID=A0ABU3BC19_9GAMM|nr:methyltransferase domain-containing protein [Salinisphaera sp. P385]MDT0619650.1 methyltransferase domain-containing protein [Salinisphaera sp. P385]
MSTASVVERYTQGAQAREEALCCPVDYDRSLLEMLPAEIVERDYGCGDPSRYVQTGDTVLDLGSGGGKICYMAAQLVGETGRVIGIDMNDEMLALARRHQADMARQLGGDRVIFHKGRIQDLALDLADTEAFLAKRTVADTNDLLALEAHQDQQRLSRPLIPDASVDLVISNCVLNLVAERDRRQMIGEIFRVLRPGGRVAISDIVADRPVPEALKRDPQLWSGCISGAFHEAAFLDAFAAAGFHGVAYDKWQNEAWQVVDGIEFRSVTLVATKGPTQAERDAGHAVLYRGPYQAVIDERGQNFPRGQRLAVSDRDFERLTGGAYGEDFVGITPSQPQDAPWALVHGTTRPPGPAGSDRYTDGNQGRGCC